MKAGDRVVCVDSKGASKKLKTGMLGTIASPPYEEEGDMRFIQVQMPDGDICGWLPYRWALVESMMPDTRDYINALSEYRAD